ncbi:MAG: hypothetical protein NC388_10575 [Clostridium sp.]|nr:hypothetical protein [Clostridium sp.]
MDNQMSKLIGNLRGIKSDETDAPYLLVKMSLKIKENEKYRKAAGRKVQVN